MGNIGKEMALSRMHRLKKLGLKVEKTIGVGMIFLLIALTTMQILGRYIFRNPLGWTEEGARFVFVWAIFYGSAVAARQQKHIKVEILINLLGKKILSLTRILVDLCTIAFLIFMIPPAIRYAIFAWELIAVAVRVPLFFVYIALPIGFALMSVFYMFNLYKSICLIMTEHK